MSSDAMTYALENGGGEADPRTYKVRLLDEWKITTKDCDVKKRDKSRLCNICKINNKICRYEDCFLRFCQTIKL
jgi:hypothetical protein